MFSEYCDHLFIYVLCRKYNRNKDDRTKRRNLINQTSYFTFMYLPSGLICASIAAKKTHFEFRLRIFGASLKLEVIKRRNKERRCAILHQQKKFQYITFKPQLITQINKSQFCPNKLFGVIMRGTIQQNITNPQNMKNNKNQPVVVSFKRYRS